MSISTLVKKGAVLFLVMKVFAVQAQSPANAAQRPGSGVRAQARQDSIPAKQRAVELLRKNLLVSGLSQAALNNYRVTDAYSDKRSGDFLVYLQQTYLGIPVYNKIGVYIFRKDSLAEKKPDFISRVQAKVEARSVEGAGGGEAGAGAKAVFSVDADQAIRFAANHLGVPVKLQPRLISKDDIGHRRVYSGEGISQRNINSDLVWLPVNESRLLKLAWNVRIVSDNGNSDWLVRVDAQTGEVLEKSSLVVSERGKDHCEEAAAPVGGRKAGGDGGRGGSGAMAGRSWVLAPMAMPEPMPLPGPMAIPGPMPGPMALPLPPAVADASYRVYPFPLESANYGSRVLDLNPWLKAGTGNNAITLGWHFDNTTNYTITRGNNVWAQQDLNGSSTTAGFADTSSTAAPSLTFDRALTAGVSPSAAPNIYSGIDNLFYWNNIMHDISYQYGFDEASGNFQADNLGRGGTGNDYVNAFAEDGAGINNANFATPPDGENPRMRMYQWNTDVTENFHVNTPAPAATDYPFTESGFNLQSQLMSTGTKTADIVLVNDFAASTHLACGTGFSNDLTGKIVLIDRGSCNFNVKVKNAQNAGAIAVIVVNTSAGATVTMGPADIAVAIPAILVSFANGNTLKANLTGLNGTLSVTGVAVDGALDNGVISHEYTHGISNRLTGGPAATDCLNNGEQMGEGWSDYMALMVTTDWSTATVSDGTRARTLGTYVENEPASGVGIRIHPYSTDKGVDPWTYGLMASVAGGEVHTIGEIWCSVLWDMTWGIIQSEGIDADIYHGTKGNNIALQLVIQGMKYQPCGPGFLDGRDAILKADSLLYNYKHKCIIWNAFAGRGMGVNARQGSPQDYTDQTADIQLPSGMGISQTVDKTAPAQGDNVTYTIRATCDCTPLTGVTIVDTLSKNLSFLTAGPGGTYTAPYVSFSGNDFAADETKLFTITANIAGNYSVPDTLINDSRDPAAYTWATAVTLGSTNFSDVTTRSHSGTHAWFAADRTTSTDFTLTSGDLLLDSLSTLSFWHYFETDGSFDGGVVEISTDGGANWQDLGPYLTKNPYNSNLTASSAGMSNRKAFSGSSGGSFIQSIISLTGFSGATARIRFRFGSDNIPGEASDEGWYIDDIVLKNEKGAISIANAFNGATLLSKSKTISNFGPVILPVNFLSFEAKKQDQTASLHWKVNEEVNVSKYVIERSADGSTFTSIGEIAGSLSASGPVEKDYFFTDAQTLEGNNFYRITERDIDGKPTVSPTKLLNFNSRGLVVRLSPVPAYDHMVRLEVQTGTETPISASLINTVGQTIKVFTVKQGINQLDLTNFSRGIYFLKVQTGRDNAGVKKLVIGN